MHEKNIALLCDEADRLLQLNINLLRQMVEEPDVLSDSKNENRLLFDKQKALKRIEELEGEQIKTARREMVLAVVGTMKAGKSTTINAIVGQEILPTDALADGLPLYVSLYPTEGGMQDIIDCIRAELGAGTTKNAVFQHIQSLPRGQQKEALLASAALPLLFRPREVQGTMFGDGGMGGWRNMQGNTPVTPLVDAGCNMVIVTHLSDGSLWDRQAFPDTTILEIRPRKRLKYAGDGDNSGGLLSFTLAHTDAWRQQGYEDTMLTMEHIRKPLAARQVLSRSETVLQKSLEITEEADLALRNAMARIK